MPASSARSATKPITSLISSSSPSQAKLNLDCLPAASESMLTLMVPMASSFAVGAVNSRSSERQAQHGIADMVPTAAHRIVLLDRLGSEDRVSAAGQPWALPKVAVPVGRLAQRRIAAAQQSEAVRTTAGPPVTHCRWNFAALRRS